MGDFMLCKNCGKQISSKTHKCKWCGTTYNMGYFYLKILFAIFVVFLMLLAYLHSQKEKNMFKLINGAVIEFNSDLEKISKYENKKPSSQSTNENKENIKPKIGVQAIQGDVGVTVNGIRQLPPGEYRTLDEGQNLYAIDVEIDNTFNTKTVLVSSLTCFSLIDTSDYKCELDLVSDAKGVLDGAVPSGAKLKGEVVFKVNDNARPKFLNVTLGLFGSSIVFDVR